MLEPCATREHKPGAKHEKSQRKFAPTTRCTLQAESASFVQMALLRQARGNRASNMTCVRNRYGRYDKQHDLSEFTDPKNYKTYDELKSRLALVLGESAPRTVKQEISLDDEIPYDNFKEAAPAAAPTETPAPAMATAEAASDDDTMSYFAALAKED